MSNEYEHLHLSSRDRQIEALERDFSSLKPNIRKAFDHILGRGEKLEKNDHADKIVEKIISLATEFVKIKKLEDINFEPLEESIINSKELIKKILPLIKELRRELFGKEDPPFPINKSKSNWDKAIEWLKNEERKEFNQWKNNIEKELGQRRKLKEERKKIEKKIHCLLNKLSKLTPGKISPLKYISIFLHYPGEEGWQSHVRAVPGFRLEKFEKIIREIIKETNFSEESLVMFILTGISPLSLLYKTTITDIIGKKRIYKLEIYRSLDREEIDKLYYKIKEAFGKKGKKFIDEKKLLFLYETVESCGGVPQRDKGKFWDGIMKECNKKYPGWFKALEPNSARITFQRLMEKITQSP